jgi:hypothetical protein
MNVTFGSPSAALVGLIVIVPLLAIVIRMRREGRFLRSVGLSSPRRLVRAISPAAVVAIVGLLALAAARPALTRTEPVSQRRDAQAFVAFDISRSMLASRGPRQPTRFARAIDFALHFRELVGEVPVGVVSFTDRPLPHLFPTIDQQTFALVLKRALGIERPPPQQRETVATNFGRLAQFGAANYFSPRARRRLVVVLTDGESSLFDSRIVSYALRSHHIRLVLVRFWRRDERIYDALGRMERGYVPSNTSQPELTSLAALAGGSPIYSERDLDAVVARARAVLGDGPKVTVGRRPRPLPLAPYLVLAAAAPLGFLLARR